MRRCSRCEFLRFRGYGSYRNVGRHQSDPVQHNVVLIDLSTVLLHHSLVLNATTAEKTAMPTMQKVHNPARRSLVTAALLICLVGFPYAVPVAAQQVAAATENRLELNIAAGSLAAALNQLANEAGLALTYAPDLVAGKTTPGLQGRFAVEQALQRLLEGSGLAHRFHDGNTVTLQRSTTLAGGPLELAPITVSGQLLERSVQDTQTSVVVISGEDLDRSNDTDFYDVVERTPGITALFGEKGFAIRGIDQNGFGQAGSTGLTVNTTVDGASLPTAQSTFFGPYSTWDLVVRNRLSKAVTPWPAASPYARRIRCSTSLKARCVETSVNVTAVGSPQQSMCRYWKIVWPPGSRPSAMRPTAISTTLRAGPMIMTHASSRISVPNC